MGTMRDEMKKWKQKNRPPKNKHKNKRKKKSEGPGFWRDIMGINKPIYGRGKGGAIRQK